MAYCRGHYLRRLCQNIKVVQFVAFIEIGTERVFIGEKPKFFTVDRKIENVQRPIKNIIFLAWIEIFDWIRSIFLAV